MTLDKTTGEILPATLEGCEQVIEAGLATFVEVGNALVAIRNGKLYKPAGHKTFDAYCKERWSFESSRARQLMGAAETVTTVTVSGLPAPTNERQARALAPLKDDPEKLAEAWEEATERAEADGTKVTTKVVEQVVAEKSGTAFVQPAVLDGPHVGVPDPLLAQRRTFTRLCRELVELGDPADLIRVNEGALSHADYVRPARQALAWLRAFLKATA